MFHPSHQNGMVEIVEGKEHVFLGSSNTCGLHGLCALPLKKKPKRVPSSVSRDQDPLSLGKIKLRTWFNGGF